MIDTPRSSPLNDTALRSLLRDCLTLWAVQGRVVLEGAHSPDDPLAEPAAAGNGARLMVQQEGGVRIETPSGTYHVAAADPDLRPVRWFLQTPERVQAARPPRAIPSIVALLSALRNALGGEKGDRLRIGTQGPA